MLNTHVTLLLRYLVGAGSWQEFGDTALHCAYRSKATECIETLLAAGADSEVSGAGPKSCKQYA